MKIYTKLALAVSLITLIGCSTHSRSPQLQFLDFRTEEALSHAAAEEADKGVHLSVSIYGFDKNTVFLLGSLQTPAVSIRSLLLRSEDGGRSWYLLNDKDRWWEQFFVGNNGELMYFQRDMDDTNLKYKNKYLFYFSKDYGSTWQFFKPKVYNMQGELILAYTFSPFLKIYQIKDTLITCDFEISAKRASYISTDLGRTWRETDFHHYSYYLYV